MHTQSLYQNVNMMGLAVAAMVPTAFNHSSAGNDVRPSPAMWHVPLVQGGNSNSVSGTRIFESRSALTARALSEKFAALRLLPNGWDGSQSVAPDVSVVSTAARVLNSSLEGLTSIAAPEIVPMADGGVQAEWYSVQDRFEMYFYPDGECAAWFQNRETGLEVEAEGLGAVQLLVRWASIANDRLSV